MKKESQWGKKVIVETQVCLYIKEPRAHQQEGQSTLAGGGPPVPVARELNCCTQEELEGLPGTRKVEQPTFCLPNDPQYSQYSSGVDGFSPLTGVQYEAPVTTEPLHNINYHNMPCAVCYTSSRVTVLMIPAKLTCPTNWTTEYTGYIMASHTCHKGRLLYECIDQAPESVPGLNGFDSNNDIFRHVEATCNSFSCPPYDAEVTCVVCTR